MTVTVSPWVVWAVLCLALFGGVFWVQQARRGVRDLRAWWRDRRDQPGAEDLCNGCLSDEADLHCDGTVGWCNCPCGWPEDWAEEELPPEQSAEALGFAGPPPESAEVRQWRGLEARRERLAGAAELEHRAAYEAMGLEYPSGLMARVREAAP